MSSKTNGSPQIGIPYRTTKEELMPGSAYLVPYMEAVRLAGAEPVPISLQLSTSDLKSFANSLGGIALSGSPADIDPYLYRERRDGRSVTPDANRERTDFGLIEYCLRDHKPILAICYGMQSLNVVLGGTLIQDIPSELRSEIAHDHDDDEPDAMHEVIIAPGSRLAVLTGTRRVLVNSSHHQAVRDPGRSLRVTAHAPDGVIEAVEWTGASNWVMGVQWHPERLVANDALSLALFRGLVETAHQSVLSAPAVSR